VRKVGGSECRYREFGVIGDRGTGTSSADSATALPSNLQLRSCSLSARVQSRTRRAAIAFRSQGFGRTESGSLLGYKAHGTSEVGPYRVGFLLDSCATGFREAGKSWPKLTAWAMPWLRCVRQLYRVNRKRLRHPCGSAKFEEQDALLRQAVTEMHAQTQEELADAKLRQTCRKVLKSLQEHLPGLIRFVDDPRIPMDNNASERAVRGPAVARKNFYGSGSLWSGRLAATMFSLFVTLSHGKINPRLWLPWYLENCVAAGGKVPKDIQPFLPWNLSHERCAELGDPTAVPATANTF
jgi:transposase